MHLYHATDDNFSDINMLLRISLKTISNYSRNGIINELFGAGYSVLMTRLLMLITG